MKKIINFIQSLQFIFRPKYWIMNESYDAAWDKKFQELAENHHFVPDCSCNLKREFGNRTYTAIIGDYRVWVSNFPYAFFSYSGKTDENYIANDIRPSRLTIAKYYKKLVSDLEKHNCKHH
jgi:hypothetical protein